MVRASDGKTRIDMPDKSIITDPAAQRAILLDHAAKQAHILPMTPSSPQMPQMQAPMPGMPQLPKPPQSAPVSVQNLGKAMIEGHPVEGMRYIVQPPAPPTPPSLNIPKPPQMPNMPQMPQAPQAPQPPMPPVPPIVSEVWTSTQLKTPVLTKVTGPFGEQTTYCKPAAAAEPHPSVFQIPPGYKMVMPKTA
jgi:hypothetical protein